MLHGSPLPQFPAYFSGAPVIYPPLGALADSVGGLAGARILSLVFMLGATVALWATAGAAVRAPGRVLRCRAVRRPRPDAASGLVRHLRRPVDVPRRAGRLARGPGRASGRTQPAGWSQPARAGAGQRRLRIRRLCSTSSCSCSPWLPRFPKPGGKLAAARAPDPAGRRGGARSRRPLLIGGSRYVHGIEQTTVFRAGGADSPLTVLADSWSWTGVIVVAAVCGVVISWASRAGRAQTWLLALLAAAALLVPLEQASLHTTASLNKHVDTGCLVRRHRRGLRGGQAGRGRARREHAGRHLRGLRDRAGPSRSHSGPASRGRSRPAGLTRPPSSRSCARWRITPPGACWSRTRLIAEYYLPPGVSGCGGPAHGTSSCRRASRTGGPSDAAGVVGPGNAGTFGLYIAERLLFLVALNFADTTSLDHSIAADI